MIVGLGVDIVSNERVARMLRRHGKRATRRLFTEAEREYCEKMANPAPHYAARFAAKEAFVKALGSGFTSGVVWSDVGVVRDGRGKPELAVKGAALEAMEALGAGKVFVSLSHDSTHAVAVVVLEGLGP